MSDASLPGENAPMSDDAPVMTVPLSKWVREVVRYAIQEHLAACPMVPRVERLEKRWIALVALMVGSGLLGAAANGILSHLAKT